jgi:spore maturation protein CgeB
MSRQTIILNYKKGFPPLKEAFESLGFRVVEDAWALDEALAQQTELCVTNLYEAARHPFRTLRLRRQLKRHAIPFIALDRDAPWHMGLLHRRLWLLQLLKPFDVYATHTMQPTFEFAPVKIYSPNAVWVRNFNLHGRTLEEMRDPNFFEIDVSFIGNMNGARFKEHAEREHFFNALAQRLAPLGLKYLFSNSTGISEEEQIRVIQHSRINLSFRSSCDYTPGKSWGLPERCYGVPARGGFLLTDARQHAADDFDLSTEWAGFTDLDSCIDRIMYYLAHFDETRNIAEAAHARVMREHTYEHRAQNLLLAASGIRNMRNVPDTGNASR